MKIFKRLLRYAKSYRLIISISVLFSIISVILNSSSIWLIGTMLGNIMSPSNSQILNPSNLNEYINYLIYSFLGSESPIEQLKNLCYLLLFIFISKNILFYISKTIISYVQNKVITKIRIKLFEHTSKLSISFFNNAKTAELNSIMISDIANMRIAFSQSLQKIIVEPISILSFLVLLFIINVKFTLIVLTIIPICAYASYMIGQSIRRKSKRSSHKIASVMNIIKETLNNIKIVKIFDNEFYQLNKFKKENLEHFDLAFKQSKLSNLLTPINETIGLLVGIILIWFGGLSVLDNQSMNPEDFIKFILLLFAMMQPIRKLANINALFQNGLASSERVFKIFDNDEKTSNFKNSYKIKKFNSEILFDNVSFRYNNKSEYVLKNINIKIRKGQTIAIVGKSGAGKSTFSDLILKLYNPNKGKITLDGINIKHADKSSLRNLFGVVTQTPILFNESIKNNILFGNLNATDDEINKALESSNLIDLIKKLPEGINTIVGENGVKLSGGEKQRLSIARAIIRNPQIMILDEATASLDSESEKLVHKAIDNVIKNKTVIIIAHRLSTIINSDKILVFDNGEIIESGKHEILIESNNKYKKLYDLQFNNE